MAGNSMKRSAKAVDTNTPKRQRAGEEDAETPTQIRLACPFHRRDPHVYCPTRTSKYFKTCASGGFKDTHRVKEHVVRIHLKCSQCNRCGAVFSTGDKLEPHQRAKQACQRIESLPRIAAITREQHEQLKRKTHTTKTEEEKWNTIYTILFPNEPIPSAFDLSPEEHEYAIRVNETYQLEGYAKLRLPVLVEETIRAMLNGSPTSRDSAQFFHLLPAAIELSITQLHVEYPLATSMLPDVVTPATSAVTPTSSTALHTIITTRGTSGSRGSSSSNNNFTPPGSGLRALDAEVAVPSSANSELDPSNSPVWTHEQFNHRMLSMESVGAGVVLNFPSTVETGSEFDINLWLDETALNVHGQ